MCVRRWNEQLPRYPGMQFRGFVYKVLIATVAYNTLSTEYILLPPHNLGGRIIIPEVIHKRDIV